LKYGFIRDHHQRFPVSGLCALLSVSKSGFHAWLNRPLCARIRADRQLLIEIRRVHVEHREAHGAVKTWRALNERGIACGKHRVARLRREGSIEAKRRQRQRLTVEHHKTAAPAPDLLVRYFNAPIPNRFWSGDMTFIRTREGWLHRPAPGLIHRTRSRAAVQQQTLSRSHGGTPYRTQHERQEGAAGLRWRRASSRT